jgi:CheY-like chemotaxis protein
VNRPTVLLQTAGLPLISAADDIAATEVIGKVRYANHFSATTWMTPGEYGCRFFVGNDENVTCYSPATIAGSFVDGMDAVVTIDIQKVTMEQRAVHILLVEDNLTTLLAYEKLLRADGYVVHIAEGYQTALDVARKERVDLAVCDINLWDGDGCDLLKDLQKIWAMKGIAVTGYTFPGETEHYREAGFDIVLHKPVDHLQIASAISELCYAGTMGQQE